jgi:hypothetical protein
VGFVGIVVVGAYAQRLEAAEEHDAAEPPLPDEAGPTGPTEVVAG